MSVKPPASVWRDVEGSKRLASALLSDCIFVLRIEPPSAGAAPSKVRAWGRERARDLRFLGGERASKWCEILGMDKTELVGMLRAQGLLYDPRPIVKERAG